MVGFLRLPFGFSGSPGLFQLTTDAIRAAHASTGSMFQERDGFHASHCHIFADGGVFVEPRLGRRQMAVVDAWGKAVCSILGSDAVNCIKKEKEGERSQKNCILGFDIDAGNLTIILPTSKMEAARTFIRSDVFMPGNYNIRLHDMQRLRGLIQYWVHTNLFWKTTIQSIDLLLPYSDAADVGFSCAVQDIWQAFRDMCTVLRSMDEFPPQRCGLFKAELKSLLEPNRRFGMGMGEEYTTWLTGDATMTRVSAVNWRDREYIMEDVSSLMSPFNRTFDEQIVIGEIELVSLRMCIVAWTYLNPDRKVLFVGTDNRNVFDWMSKGEARSRRARRILSKLLAWSVAKNLQIFAIYVRSGHNTAADFLTRASDDEINMWSTKTGFKRKEDVRAMWGDFAAYGPHELWEKRRGKN